MLRSTAALFSKLSYGAKGSSANSWQRLMSSGEGANPKGPLSAKSVLDAVPQAAPSDPTGQAMAAASEMYMQRVKAEMAAAGVQQAAEQPGVVRKLFSALFDLMGISMLGAAGFGAFLYWKYDITELEAQVQKAEEANVEKLLNHEKQPITQQAWIMAVSQYLDIAKPLQSRIKPFTDPPTDRLLPDMPPGSRGYVKTLVLDLEGLLVHKEWTRARGWQIHKRPGVQEFLNQMSQFYEIVIFTDELNIYADPIIDKLDTYRAVPYRLYRQDTQYHNGKHVRDLSKLNRSLGQVLFISCKPDAYEFQPENTIKLKCWHGDHSDTTLLDLVPMLHMIATRGVRDVRDVVRSYDEHDDVVAAFKTRMHQLAEQQKQQSRGKGLLGGLIAPPAAPASGQVARV